MPRRERLKTSKQPPSTPPPSVRDGMHKPPKKHVTTISKKNPAKLYR